MSIENSDRLNQLETWHKLVTKEKDQYQTFADAIQVFLPVVRIPAMLYSHTSTGLMTKPNSPPLLQVFKLK